MATIVHKTVNGYGKYAYHVEYLGGGKQHWEFLGRVDSVGIKKGPTDMNRDEAVEAAAEDTDQGREEIDSSELRDMIREGFKLDEAPDGVEINEWSRNTDRLYINGWIPGGEDPWINQETGVLNDVDATVTREDRRVMLTPEEDGEPITLQTNFGVKWEPIEARDIERGDTVRLRDGASLGNTGDGTMDRSIHRIGGTGAAFDIADVEILDPDNAFRPGNVTAETDLGELDTTPDADKFERAVQEE